jgi:exodeoxyribonuclease V beta subunit
VLERAVGARGVDVASALETALSREGFSAREVAANAPVARRALERVLERPLEGALGSRSLLDLAGDDVAKEMRFVASLGTETSGARLGALAQSVLDHDRSGPDGRGLFRDYFAALADSGQGLDEGFLVGSLDLVARREDGRYLILDYKTDQLPGARRPFAAEHLVASMAHEHYPLQALLYSVVLHRHLRATLATYDPERHLAGVAYYYLRVVGDETSEAEDGCVTWELSPAAVVAASRALERVS